MAKRTATKRKAPAKQAPPPPPRDLLVRELVTSETSKILDQLQRQYGVGSYAKAIRIHFAKLTGERDKATKDEGTVDAVQLIVTRIQSATERIDSATKERDRATAELFALMKSVRKYPRQSRIDDHFGE